MDHILHTGQVAEWVRPDLNRSRQHPKLVGFPVGRMTRGPRAQTKLPHGPAGDSNRLAAKNVFVRLVLADPHHGANDQEKEPGAAKQGRDEDAHGDEHDTHDDAGGPTLHPPPDLPGGP